MDAAGLAVGVVALWKSCVQVFEVISLTRQYGMDYEILSIKLEVERVRLLSWGHAVGLSDVANRADTRLKRIEVHSAVIRLGLRLSLATPEEGGLTTAEEQPSQSQMILGGVFTRAYANLRRIALERQRNTPIIRRSKWAVHDRKKFMALVAEVRGFNDSLESLFPDAKLRMMDAMQSDIDQAVQVRDLQLLQEATAGEQGLEDISERASIRLEALGSTASAGTELPSGPRSVLTVTEDREEDRAERETVEGVDEGAPGNDQALENKGQLTVSGEQEMDELSKQLRDVHLYVQRKSAGALTLSRIGPYAPLPRCSAHAYWDGDNSDHGRWDPWADRDKGFVPMLHASFG